MNVWPVPPPPKNKHGGGDRSIVGVVMMIVPSLSPIRRERVDRPNFWSPPPKGWRLIRGGGDVIVTVCRGPNKAPNGCFVACSLTEREGRNRPIDGCMRRFQWSPQLMVCGGPNEVLNGCFVACSPIRRDWAKQALFLASAPRGWRPISWFLAHPAPKTRMGGVVYRQFVFQEFLARPAPQNAF